MGVGLGEGTRVLVSRGASHARVSIAQKVQFGDAQDIASAAQLPLADLGYLLLGAQAGIVDLSLLSTGGTDQGHFDPLSGVFGQCPPDAKALIVRMGENG